MINHVATSRTVRAGALAAGLLACTAIGASAAPYTFNFTSSGGTVSGSDYTNSRLYSQTVAGVTLKVTVQAYSASSSSANFFNAQLGYHSGGGLGVCAQIEGLSCSSPEHQVDNNDRTEYVMFTFSLPVNPTSIVVGASPDGYDQDLRYWVNTAALNNVTTMTPSQLGTGFSSPDNFNGSNWPSGNQNPRTATLDQDSGQNLVLIIAAGGTDSYKDYFKIRSLTVDYTPTPGGAGNPVPTPAALVLFGTAIAGLALGRRRRN